MTPDEAKRAAAEAAATLVEPGMRVGLGSGSTSLRFVEALGRRVAAGLALGAAVATSRATEEKAREFGIAMVDMLADGAPDMLDLAVDGADEVDGALNLLKGGGASLTREKIAASLARRFVVIVDGSKIVDTLGRFALPVEVVPFGWSATRAVIARRFSVTPTLRQAADAALVTDNGNFILDCPFGTIADPEALGAELSALPGVVEHGLFCGMADEVLVARASGIERLTRG